MFAGWNAGLGVGCLHNGFEGRSDAGIGYPKNRPRGYV